MYTEGLLGLGRWVQQWIKSIPALMERPLWLREPNDKQMKRWVPSVPVLVGAGGQQGQLMQKPPGGREQALQAEGAAKAKALRLQPLC